MSKFTEIRGDPMCSWTVSRTWSTNGHRRVTHGMFKYCEQFQLAYQTLVLDDEIVVTTI